MSMTTQEIYEIIGKTMERLKEARKELACLNHNARYLSKDLELVALVMRGEVEGMCNSGYFIVNSKKGSKDIRWPIVQDLNDILMSRRRLEEEIIELEKEARQMGYEA